MFAPLGSQGLRDVKSHVHALIRHGSNVHWNSRQHQLQLELTMSLDDFVCITSGEMTPSRESATLAVTRPEQLSVADDDLTDCERDVIDVLRTAGHRMTTSQIFQATEAAGHLHGETTIRLALSHLVKLHVLDNASHAQPRGYGVL